MVDDPLLVTEHNLHKYTANSMSIFMYICNTRIPIKFNYTWNKLFFLAGFRKLFFLVNIFVIN